MTRRWLTLGTVLVAVSASMAHAETRTLSSSGLWSSYGGTDAEQRPVCGVVTVGGDGRRIDIAQYAVDGGIDLSLQKESWSIPANTQIPLQVQFDRDGAVPSRGVGDGRRVLTHLSFEQSVPFMRALRQGLQIRVLFPSGNEPAWTGGLSGSGRAIDAFNDCRARLVSRNPTQPFASGPSGGAPSGGAFLQGAPPPAPAPVPAAPTQPFAGQPMPPAAPTYQNTQPSPYPNGLPPLPPPT